MTEKMQAKAYLLGNNIDTDQIYPGRYLELTDPVEIASHCLEGADSTLSARFEKGGIIAAGTNFGCGSSREHAAIALSALGVSVVLAESFARIFYRNGINLALPLMVCPGIQTFMQDGDTLSVDLARGEVLNMRTGETLIAQKISDYAMDILMSGGIKPLFRKRMGKE